MVHRQTETADCSKLVMVALLMGIICSLIGLLGCSYIVYQITGQPITNMIGTGELELGTALHLALGFISCVTTATVFCALLWKRYELRYKEIRGEATLVG